MHRFSYFLLLSERHQEETTTEPFSHPTLHIFQLRDLYNGQCRGRTYDVCVCVCVCVFTTYKHVHAHTCIREKTQGSYNSFGWNVDIEHVEEVDELLSFAPSLVPRFSRRKICELFLCNTHYWFFKIESIKFALWFIAMLLNKFVERILAS